MGCVRRRKRTQVRICLGVSAAELNTQGISLRSDLAQHGFVCRRQRVFCLPKFDGVLASCPSLLRTHIERDFGGLWKA